MQLRAKPDSARHGGQERVERFGVKQGRLVQSKEMEGISSKGRAAQGQTEQLWARQDMRSSAALGKAGQCRVAKGNAPCLMKEPALENYFL